nr:DUF2461 family protein [Brucepastera parasyntrophica]
MVRNYLVNNTDEFLKIINKPAFTENFTVSGEKLKTVPRRYDKDHPLAEYLKHKSWDIEYPISDSQFTDAEQFIRTAAEKFKLMKPFNEYLNDALIDFTMPARK